MSSSSVADAASDPGGDGEAKQELPPKVVDAAGVTAGDGEGSSGPAAAGDADVTPTEAVEEAPAVAGMKVEGEAVVAGDAAAAIDVIVSDEGGAAVVNDPLYATESAGMVSVEGSGDKSVDDMQGLDGRDSGEEKLEVEAGGLLSEAERKPVLAGDGAVAGEAAGATDSTTTEHAEAESNTLEQNCVNRTPETGNKGKDNGVANCNKEIQNNVLCDVEGSSKIHEDDGASMLVQQDGRSEMHPPTWEQVNNQSSNGAASPANFDKCARYCFPPLDKSGFRVADLVWGKVKSHPWWPGEIFDPLDASELALKHQKKASHLVAYFGDSTFAWCDESQLKPFVTNYSQMEKQSSSDAFVSSVNYALEELSRRILSGMSCSCLPEELSDNGLSYMVENAGLKDGVTCSAVNRSEILTCFSPESLLHYIKSLALFPGQGGDLLELVIACSQLTSFYRSRGCPELASFQTSCAWIENGMDTSSTRTVVVEEAATNEVHPSNDKPKRGRGRPQKQKPEDDLELMDKKATSNMSNDTSDDPVEGQTVMDFDDFDDLQYKKKRSLDSFEDSETKPSTSTFGSSFKIGECIRRAASQLTGSSSIVKSQNEPMVYKNINEAENGEFDISSDDADNELTVEKRAKRRRMHRHHIADPKELLSQLFSVAIEPMNGYSFSAMLISYYSDYRNYIVSTTTEANIIEKTAAKRGRKRRVLPSPDVETTDHMQDSYWSGLSLHNHPIHSLRGGSTNMRPRRRHRASRETNGPSVQNLQLGAPGPKKQIQVIERSIIHVDEKTVDECKPTALVLSFGRSTVLPSESDLIKMFGRYGPLKESETEVHRKSNTVKVVFKKRADAERAFSAAGKYGTFGPSLRSYRLVNMPFYLGLPEVNNPEEHQEDHGLKVCGSHEPEVPLDAMQVDQINKAEALKEPSAEQVETVLQICQTDASDNALVDQVGMVEQTGQIDTEVSGRPNQIGTDPHSEQAETIAEESSQQVGTIEQAYTPDEAPLKDQSEIALHGQPDQIGTDAHSEQAETIAEETSEQVGTIEQAYTQDESSLKDQSEIALHGRPDQIGTDAHSEQAVTIAEESSEQVGTIEQAYTQDEVLFDLSEIAHGRPDQIGTGERSEQAETIAEESSEQVGTIEQAYTQAEVPLRDRSKIALLGDATGALNGGTVDEIHLGKTPNEALPEVLSNTLQMEAVSEAQIEDTTKLVSHADATNEDLPEVLSDTIHVDNVVEAPRQGHVFGDNASEAVSEALIIAQIDTVEQTVQEASDVFPTSPIQTVTVPEASQGANVSSDALHCKAQTEEVALVDGVIEQAREESLNEASEDVMEADTGNAAREETSASLELQDQSFTDLTKASALEVASNKQNVESETPSKALAELVSGIEQTIQVEALTEASGGEIEAGKQITEDVAMADATTKQLVTVVGAAESKMETPAVEFIENEAVPEPLAGETAVGKMAAEAQDEKLENNTTVEALSAETEEVVATADVAVENQDTHNKAIAEALAGETTHGETTSEAPDEETTVAEKIVEDTTVESSDEKTTASKKTIEGATTEAPDEKTTTAEKTVEGATIEALDEKTTMAEKMVEGAAEAPDENVTTAKKTIEGATIEALDEKTTPAEKTVEDAMVEELHEKTADKTAKDATVEAPNGQVGVTEQTG